MSVGCNKLLGYSGHANKNTGFSQVQLLQCQACIVLNVTLTHSLVMFCIEHYLTYTLVTQWSFQCDYFTHAELHLQHLQVMQKLKTLSHILRRWWSSTVFTLRRSRSCTMTCIIMSQKLPILYKPMCLITWLNVFLIWLGMVDNPEKSSMKSKVLLKSSLLVHPSCAERK